jgi:hypothetical protein
MTKFEWDENKRLKTLRERGLDFLDARSLFDGRNSADLPASTGKEERWIRIGVLGEKLYAVVWTQRNEKVRLTSFRRARVEEEGAYRQLHG